MFEALNEEQMKLVMKQYKYYMRAYPNWRKGQCFFNALHYTFPVIANCIRGTQYDTFYAINKKEIKICADYISL